jgi:hypothetical protein
MAPLLIRDVEESMSDRQAYRWKDFISLAFFAAFFGAAFLIASDAASSATSKIYLCTNNENQRRIELRYEGVGELPCSVWYYRDSAPGRQIFRSNNTVGFCDGKALNFMQDFERSGYQCNVIPADTSDYKTMCGIHYPATWQVSLDSVAGKFYIFPSAGDYLAQFNFFVEVTPNSSTIDHENESRANPDIRLNQNPEETAVVKIRVLDIFRDRMSGPKYLEKTLPIMPDQQNNKLVASLDIAGENLNTDTSEGKNGVRYVCKVDKSFDRTRFARMCQTIIEATTLTDHHSKAGLCDEQAGQP